MPSSGDLAALYGASYNGKVEVPPGEGEDPRAAAWVLAELGKQGVKRVADYGCGNGGLLAVVAAQGVEAVGFDIDRAGVEAATEWSGCSAYTFDEMEGHQERFDAVHLGDVLEHVPDPVAVLRDACGLLRPGGVLLAQGPLEANRSVFNMALAVVALLARSPGDADPYHVHLVSARGQRALFARCGLFAESFVAWDVTWPAPDRLDRATRRSVKLLALFAVRRLSTLVARMAGEASLNRFCYLGRIGPVPGH